MDIDKIKIKLAKRMSNERNKFLIQQTTCSQNIIGDRQGEKDIFVCLTLTVFIFQTFWAKKKIT